MKRLTDIFNTKERTFSFEIFPPKTGQGMAALEQTLTELALFQPDFISVTYGAGGGSRDKTLGLVRSVQEKHGLTALHHFTCVLHTRSQIKAILDELKSLGIRNLLALRGDPPKDNPNWTPGPEHFRYSSELVRFIRENYGDQFTIGVAGFPEGHILSPDRQFDVEIMKKKVDAGAEFVITQLFFDNNEYFDYVLRLRALGLKIRVIPGILPIVNYEGAVKFCQGCGASFPQNLNDIFAPIAHDKEKTLAAGTRFAIDQCRELLAAGAPGVHLYTLNKVEPVRTILKAVR